MKKLNKKAFTLIEVLVVLLVVGLIMGLVIPQAGRIFRSNLKMASSNIAGVIKYAYDTSVISRSIIRVVFDFEKQTYTLQAAKPGVLVEIDTEDTYKRQDTEYEENDDEEKKENTFFNLSGTWGRIKELPNGVAFDSIVDYKSNIEFTKDLAYMYFFPQGQTQSFIIRLKGNNAGFYSIKVNPINADTVVEGRYIEE